jgi:hypothetical protein
VRHFQVGFTLGVARQWYFQDSNRRRGGICKSAVHTRHFLRCIGPIRCIGCIDTVFTLIKSDYYTPSAIRGLIGDQCRPHQHAKVEVYLLRTGMGSNNLSSKENFRG